MPLFQNSVVAKYLKTQDKTHLTKQWNDFKNHFHNPTIQENIRNSKEEQYQEGFLRDLFVKILGYSLNPDTNFNLTTEYKNVKDSKKADGAILIDDKVKAVIELKGTNTTDLGKIETQAFGYKNNQPDCVYVITSNFEKIRFYIDNAIEHIEFNLFTLTEADFDLLYLCLAFENISKNIAKKIKDESVSEEDVITKKLYKDYSLFKRELHQNLVQLNPEFDPLDLFKKSQKLLDRFLFLFFGEDRHLLPPNSVRLILAQWKQLDELDQYTPLYERFKKYFGYLNTGYKGKQYDVYAYNGGLFKPDEILDSIKIDDDLLYTHTLKLSEYDFASEVDVNILGHIFENSLNELDEIKAQLEGQEIDKTKTKRKKDGVFYTPKYITKYIVENTIGKLCEEKKVVLSLTEEEYSTDKKRQKKTIKELVDKLETYRKWLLQLTICDPACGSGAFLNQALDFLIEEHQYIDELQAKLFGDALVLTDMENSILENNLFGVDLNEESVEIAKLSLWLRTAQPNRKLNDLSGNIKCGNSLIDDQEVAGDKAFNWQTAFPQVFKEKQKKPFHITTAIHDSRTSQRMIDYKVREKRALGTMPEPQVNYLTDDDEMVIAETVSILAKELQLNILAFNVCKDHIHIVLVCEEDDIDEIVRKIKGRTAREVNKNNGINPVINKDYNNELAPIVKESTGAKTVPLWTQKFGCKAIVDQNQLQNTIAYVKNNREKHNLPPHSNKGFKPLVESIACPHEHAFRAEYKGGFDVIIGNPPYVFARDNFKKEEKDFFVNEYVSAKYQINTYLLFIEKAVHILKENGIYGLIIPNSWLMMYSGEGLRKFLLETNKLNQIINLAGYSFESANVETVILLAEKETIKNENSIQILLNNGNEFYFSHSKLQTEFANNDGFEFKVFLDNDTDELNLKITSNSEELDSLVEIKAGLQAYEKDKGDPKQTAEDVKNRPYDYDYQFDENTFKYLDGKDVGRYFLSWSGLYLRYGKHLAAPRTFNLFDGKKIIVREITGNFPKCLITTYSEDVYLYNRSNIAIVEKVNSEISLKYITAILNSKLISYYFIKNTAKSVRKLFPKIILNDLRKFPIKNISLSGQQPFIEKADLMLSLNKDLQDLSQKFQRTLQRKFELTDLPKKLQDWYLLSYGEFIKELGKKKIKLSLSQEAEWEDYFNQEQQKALALKQQIDTTDKEIDQMVYDLYGLTEEEIEIVENS
jgi:type I restriction-modification system DNA methylase subunit/REP element-mobilizing transposase RayT